MKQVVDQKIKEALKDQVLPSKINKGQAPKPSGGDIQDSSDDDGELFAIDKSKLLKQNLKNTEIIESNVQITNPNQRGGFG